MVGGIKENVMRVRIVAVIFVLVFVSSSAFAIVGPPTSGLEKGQWSGGFNYFYSSQDLDKTKIDYDYFEFDSGGAITYSETGTYKLEIKDFNINRYFGRVSYGILEDLDVYVQFGIADVKARSREVGDTEWYGYNADNEFAWGLGAKGTFAKQEKVDWGASVQANWFSLGWDGTFNYDDGAGYTEVWTETVDIDALEIFVLVGPTVDMGGWYLYGGPFYHYLLGDYEYKEEGLWTDTTIPDNGSWCCTDTGDADTNSFGGLIGAQYDIYKNYRCSIEFLASNNGWGAGAGIEIPF